MINLVSKCKPASEGIRLNSIRIFVELFGSNSAMEIDLLTRRFRERAREFEKILKFMQALKAVTTDKRNVIRASGLDRMERALRKSQRAFVEHIAKVCVESKTAYGGEMRAMLNAFKLSEGMAWLKPEDMKEKYYATRNMLIEAGAIRLDHEAGTYMINHWFYREFIGARYLHGITPHELRSIIEKQAEIGAKAELKVFEYELAIVGARDADKVVHIALENSAAGFDIMSVRRKTKKQLCLRMIEVKAVSSEDWAFTLTSNEIRRAEEDGNTYFLYLVPVIKGNLAVDKMQMIKNPLRELLHSVEWNVEKGDWKIKRIVQNV